MDKITEVLVEYYEKNKSLNYFHNAEYVWNNMGFFKKYHILNTEFINKEDTLFGINGEVIFSKQFIFFSAVKYNLTDDLTHIEIKDTLTGENLYYRGKRVNYVVMKSRGLINPYLREILGILIHTNENIENENLKQMQSYIFQDLDKDGNGEVDVIEGDDFNKLLQKNQKKVIEIDRSYIQKFVKVSNYLQTKRKNIQLIFESIKNARYSELKEQANLLKNQIHIYEILLFHSISMIASLVDDNMIVFYEIYESFDKFGIFNSNWENEVTEKLSSIGSGLNELMHSINKMENRIANEISNLTYVTQDSFKELNHSVTRQLGEINSSMKFNNLLTGIQTYQMYRINKNTQ